MNVFPVMQWSIQELGNAISSLVMVSIVVLRLFSMVGDEVMMSFLPDRQCSRKVVHLEALQALTALLPIDLID